MFLLFPCDVHGGFRREGSWSCDQSPIALISRFLDGGFELGHLSDSLAVFVEVVPSLLRSPVSLPVPWEPWHSFIWLVILDGRWLWS